MVADKMEKRIDITNLDFENPLRTETWGVEFEVYHSTNSKMLEYFSVYGALELPEGYNESLNKFYSLFDIYYKGYRYDIFDRKPLMYLEDDEISSLHNFRLNKENVGSLNFKIQIPEMPLKKNLFRKVVLETSKKSKFDRIRSSVSRELPQLRIHSFPVIVDSDLQDQLQLVLNKHGEELILYSIQTELVTPDFKFYSLSTN